MIQGLLLYLPQRFGPPVLHRQESSWMPNCSFHHWMTIAAVMHAYDRLQWGPIIQTKHRRRHPRAMPRHQKSYYGLNARTVTIRSVSTVMHTCMKHYTIVLDAFAVNRLFFFVLNVKEVVVAANYACIALAMSGKCHGQELGCVYSVRSVV